ncbi:hypothetical protein N7523_003413 [Penicillium sp. IBT 18751x]|nr:hypothetical protein N7523_003413 [Penicillium sp. IBT 18751x]
MTEKGRRQQPGFACEECRRRKARCDRERPKCGLCKETGTVCVVLDQKQQRGPKKGQLNAMRSQIASLQWQLNQQLGYESDSGLGASGQRTPERCPETDPAPYEVRFESGGHGLASVNETDINFFCISPSAAAPVMTPTVTAATQFPTLENAPPSLRWPDWAMDWGKKDLAMHIDTVGLKSHFPSSDIHMTDHNTLSLPEPMTQPDHQDTIITDHMCADLDQVYFDRVHPVLPIIYRLRFFSWADQDNPGVARACLRLAMRTMAAAMSAPGHRFCDQLYAETCQFLQAHSVGLKTPIALEYIQAWLLVAHYELLRVGEHQAMLTAGRCFRLVLMARLSDIDAPNSDEVNLQTSDKTPSCDVLGETFAVVEEQRRTFWLTFCLDRFLCSRNEYPLTLEEEMICTRLPAPETNFQNNKHIRTSFLPEAMSESQNGPLLSPFAESIILATLHGRCMAHRRSFTKQSHRGSSDGDDFWIRQKRLATAVEKRIQALGTISSAKIDSSPLLLFVHMLAYSAVIKLGHTAQTASSARPTIEHQGATAAYERRASSAVVEMVRLAKQVPSFGCFKGHPFLPDPLACAANFLTAKSDDTVFSDAVGIRYLLRLLKDMQGMNSLARGYFDRLHSAI